MSQPLLRLQIAPRSMVYKNRRVFLTWGHAQRHRPRVQVRVTCAAFCNPGQGSSGHLALTLPVQRQEHSNQTTFTPASPVPGSPGHVPSCPFMSQSSAGLASSPETERTLSPCQREGSIFAENNILKYNVILRSAFHYFYRVGQK